MEIDQDLVYLEYCNLWTLKRYVYMYTPSHYTLATKTLCRRNCPVVSCTIEPDLTFIKIQTFLIPHPLYIY